MKTMLNSLESQASFRMGPMAVFFGNLVIWSKQAVSSFKRRRIVLCHVRKTGFTHCLHLGTHVMNKHISAHRDAINATI